LNGTVSTSATLCTYRKKLERNKEDLWSLLRVVSAVLSDHAGSKKPLSVPLFLQQNHLGERFSLFQPAISFSFLAKFHFFAVSKYCQNQFSQRFGQNMLENRR
jgi:hypothetical protein